MSRPSVVIVSPAVAASNNGNWQTARRWRELLTPMLDARVAQNWPDAEARGADVLLALHARRSAESIQEWARDHGGEGLAVVLTGTDLYQDIAVDTQAQRSLELASRLIVLQDLGLDALPQSLRGKARVIYQSTEPQTPASKPPHIELHAVMVGHLREVKSPQTLFEAARLLAGRGIRIDHIGEALDPALGRQALATQRDCACYRWLGGLPHAETRERIRRADLLIHASAMEGGAHVIMEAVCSGTPVLASRIPGNVGMLGADYAGYFPHGDATALAALLLKCRRGQQAAADTPPPALMARLGAQCALRAPLFAPEAERSALLRLIAELMDSNP